MPNQEETSTAKRVIVHVLMIALHTLKWLLTVALIGSFLIGGIAFGYFTSLVKSDPVRSKAMILQKLHEYDLTGYVYFKDGSLVGQLRTNQDRQLVNLSAVPQRLKDAVISIEDKTFYQNDGIDLTGLFRAIKEQLLHEQRQTGGSTITQQLARNVFLTLDQTYSRKAKEILLSLRLNRLLTKEDILQAYLNKVPFGNGSNGYLVYGIKAAAKGIFGVTDLNQLNLAECAYLAGLPNAPSNLSAFTGNGAFNPDGFKNAVEREHLVLSRMKALGKITDAQYQEAMKFDIKGALASTKAKAYSTYPYLMPEIERRAAIRLIEQENPRMKSSDITDQMIQDVSEQLRHDGYKIYTTVDKTIYDEMQKVAHNPKDYAPNDPKKGMEQVGAVMMDNKTGAILGMIGGRDFNQEQLNHATQMLRQPGSTMKPLAAYIPALEMGAIQPGTPIDDAPIILPDGQRGFFIPVNWDYRYHGLMTAREALNESYNIPALKLFNNVVGIPKAWDYARKMGITSLTKSDNYARTGVIGGLEHGVSVIDLTGAYATMGNDGVHNAPYMITKIVDSEGQVVYQHQRNPTRVFSPETDFLITDMLRTVVKEGTASGVIPQKFKYYGKIAAVGKTGTTENDRDAWYMGYTPNITVGVWTGYDQPATLPYGSGTHAPLQVWADILNRAVASQPQLFPTTTFTKPNDIVKMTVSSVTGQLPSKLDISTGHTVTDWFNKKYLPTTIDRSLKKMNVITYHGLNYIPNPGTPKDFIQNKLVFQRKPSVVSIIDKIAKLFKKYPNRIPDFHGHQAALQDYYPSDAGMDLPTLTDPRKDDGKAPDAPTKVRLYRTNDIVKITFTPSLNKDIVGYRLYRSLNGGNYMRQQGVVMADGNPHFLNYITPSDRYTYYVTAVDVAGNESAASNTVTYDGAHTGGNLPRPPQPTGQVQGQTSPKGESQNPGSTTDSSGSFGAAPSSPANLKAAAIAGGTGVVLSWTEKNPPSGTRYHVYFSSSKQGKFTLIGTTDTTQFQYIAKPAAGWYEVSAIDKGGQSPPCPAIQFRERG